MDIQHACLSKIVVDGDLQPFIDARIHEGFFKDIKHRKVFEMVMQHYRKEGKAPSVDVIHRAYPRYPFNVNFDEATEYYLSQLQEDRKLFLLLTGIKEANEKIRDPEGATPGTDVESILRQALFTASHEIPQGVLGNFFGETADHLALLDYRASNPGLVGISTGFPTIDKVTNGLQKTQLITLTGLPKSGKSSVALSMARTGTLQGARVLYFTFEMSIQEQNDRLMSLLSGIDLNKILQGTLSKSERARIEKILKGYFAFDERMMFSSTLGGTSTLSGAQARIQDIKPDLVVVDGVYLMQDESHPPFQEGSSQALTALTRGFKRMAQRLDVPIVLSTQALEARSKGGLTLSSIGYSSSFAQDSDVVFGAERVQGTEEIKLFKVLGIRSGPKINCYIRTDWDRGRIEEIPNAEAEQIIKAVSTPEAAKSRGVADYNPADDEPVRRAAG